MSEAAQRARRQERIESLSVAAARALSGVADLHYRAGRLHRGQRALPLFAPYLQPDIDRDDLASFRGAADGNALRLRFSDPKLHGRSAPAEPVERLVFELLEQFRAESQVPAGMPGVRANLRHRFDAWSLAFHAAGMTDTARGILLFTVAQVCRARVTGDRVAEEIEDLLETTRGNLAPRLGADLAGLRRTRADQAAYAVHALAIAQLIGAMLQSADDEDGAAIKRDGMDEKDLDRLAFSLVTDPGAETTERFATAVSGRSPVLDAASGGYRIFTTTHDRERPAAALARPALLRELRVQLDQRIAESGVVVSRLARELRALLAVPAVDGWDGGQEEGHIDGRRLAQLVASPAERRLFRTEHIEPSVDCAVTVLIDCSGSMKEHIDALAPPIDVFARALEQAGATCEVLGFTTGAWAGGRAQRDWVRAGRPAHPGRLNEVSHLVFKAATTPWRHARLSMSALLKADLFREGIDGEAVDWACRRLLAREAPRRLLLVVSDGSPMDSATNLANDAHYLDQHLREVVAAHERAGRVEIFGVGVALDLSPYYRRSHVLDLENSTPRTILRELIEMIARPARR